MAFTVLRLTPTRLATVTDAQLAAFAARIPVADRCNAFGTFPTRAGFDRYARDITVDPNTFEVQTLGLFGGVILDESNDLYGAVLFKTLGGGALDCKGWFSPIDNRTVQALSAVEDLLTAAGISTIEGIVTNERVRRRLLNHPKIVQVPGKTGRLRYTI